MAATAVEIPTRLLVLGMMHADGTIEASELYPVAEACGQSAEQIRSCLRRLVQEGLFTREGKGANARFRATAAGLAATGATVERNRLAYAQDLHGKGWDRLWRLVAFAVPERRRAGRDAFRDHLRALGGAAVQNGLYVSPHPWHDHVLAEADRLGIAGEVTVATTDDLVVGGERDPRALVRRLWPVEDLQARYDRFVARWEDVPANLVEMRRRREKLPDTEFLPGALGMAVEYFEVFRDDPMLPPELLPRPWPGKRARELVLQSRRLALHLRQAHGRAPLFRVWEDAIEAIS